MKWVHNTDRQTVAGLAAVILLPVLARAVSSFDYAADIALAAAIIGWWAAAWLRRQFHWLLWSATAGWLFSLFIGMVTPLWLVAWVALAALYQAVGQCRSWWHAAAAGACAGMVASIAGLDWVLHGFAHYTGWSSLAAALFFLPFCLVALWQLAAWSVIFYLLKKWRVPLWTGALPAAAFAALDAIPMKPAHIYWGYSQWPWKSLIQVVDLTGAPGLAFLIGWSGYVVWQATSAWLHRNSRSASSRRGILRTSAPFAAVVVLVLLYGFWRHTTVAALQTHDSARQITVAGVQSDAPERVPNKATELKTELAKKIVRMGATAAQSADNVDLIVYAESTAPMGFKHGYNPIFRTAYQVVAKNSGAFVLVDNIGYSSATASQPARMWREFLLLNPRGEIESAYQKKRLVPVGESMPFEAHAPWLREVFSIGTTYQRGTGPATVQMRDIKIAPLVCVEGLHEDLARNATRQGADILISPSNDGWFRSAKQARQHLWGAGFRAIENRRPFIRVANTGYSAAITPAGDTLKEISPLREPWIGTWQIKVKNTTTLYTRAGHWFALTCTLALIAATIRTLSRRPR